MNRKKKPATGASRPVNIYVAFRVYAFIFGLLGLIFLVRGTGQARTFSAICLASACCAAGLSFAGDARLLNRSLFWFAMGHAALWLAALGKLNWAWGAGPLDEAAAFEGTTAFFLFYAWLTLEGEFPQESYFRPFGPAVASPNEPLRSQYEQKIRQAAAQEERNRLARDLHDSIKQQIFAIQTAAATAQVRSEGGSSGAREALEQIRSAAREAMTEMEVMLDQLRAEPLESTGLVAALRKLCESISFRTGAEVEFKLGSAPPTGLAAPGAAEATLRVAQEALANVARHARASRVVVCLDSAEDRTDLTVQDNGAGFDPNQDSPGMGTANMRARAEELGGHLEIVSRPDAGTTVKFSIPAARTSNTSMRYKYRNRTIALGLMLVTLFLNTSVHHWSLAPALAFIVAIAVAQYLKSSGSMRRLNQPVL